LPSLEIDIVRVFLVLFNALRERLVYAVHGPNE
jgi:hypothetical protein